MCKLFRKFAKIFVAMRKILLIILAMVATAIVACEKTDDLSNDAREIIDDNEDAGTTLDVDTTWSPRENVDL